MKNTLLFFFIFSIIGCTQENPKFDKLIYRTTGCFGTCPTYYLEINNDRTFKLFAETVFKEETSIFDFELDSAKMGYFKGSLDEVTYNTLNKKIQMISEPNYKYYKDDVITDTPTVTLIVQRGGDKTCYNTFNPTNDFQNNVINFLNNICSGKVEKGEKFNTDYKFDCF
ncbi:DUF6438 domain-containing protein [Chryseobacterium luquanense]|uniref:DUF6438 domain-containing protein n=1 Tax=Chryseobacterium luquanense TaxID=2983766 RepID=A0ABT3XYV0_9FLAO|nr:DUF6438 domain-containing protein [Chryseobacterium luquanense]MCX8531071.1 DUF6438 domain-containing protein [Chryseobacterium luquanense]